MAFQAQDIAESFTEAQQPHPVRRLNPIAAPFDGQCGWRVFRTAPPRAMSLRKTVRAILGEQETFITSETLHRLLANRGFVVSLEQVQNELGKLHGWKQLTRNGLRGKRGYALRARTSVDDHC